MASLSVRRSSTIEQLALRILGLFIPALALWLWIAPIYSDAIFGLSQALLNGSGSPDVAIAGNTTGVPTVYHLGGDTEQPIFRFDRVGLFFNTIVLLVLMLAVPHQAWRTRAFRLALGIGLLGLTHVGFVALQTQAQFINLGLISTSEGGAYLVNWLAVLAGPIGEGLFPVAIALGLSWRAWAETFNLRIGIREFRADAARNEPCPCGSGRKHKRCCGSR